MSSSNNSKEAVALALIVIERSVAIAILFLVASTASVVTTLGVNFKTVT